LIYAVPFGAGLVLQGLWPFHFLPVWPRIVLALVCLVPATILLVSGTLAFRRSRTSMLPARRARHLIVAGPFRYTRNPLYLGLILVYAGVSTGLNLAWSLAQLPLVIVGIYYVAIRPEERRLEQQFGDAYRHYKTTVRRWL